VTWLVRAPYRVWKNRRERGSFDYSFQATQRPATGIGWEGPELEGDHADPYWATPATREAPITVVTESPGLFLRLFTPGKPGGPGSRVPDGPACPAAATDAYCMFRRV
jgi:hypothetical protein